jgi:hypothetical protein
MKKDTIPQKEKVYLRRSKTFEMKCPGAREAAAKFAMAVFNYLRSGNAKIATVQVSLR